MSDNSDKAIAWAAYREDWSRYHQIEDELDNIYVSISSEPTQEWLDNLRVLLSERRTIRNRIRDSIEPPKTGIG